MSQYKTNKNPTVTHSLGGTCFEELELFKRNGAVKKLPFKLQRHYEDLIEKPNNALVTYSELTGDQKHWGVTSPSP